MPVLVSVHMVTFNHVKYIKEAIEGVLMQQTNFNIELVIGDDFSTDGTRQICQDYYDKYPDKIKLLLHEQNLGGGGKLNSMAVLSACEGKYIALCEGDDYWTSPSKLQMQVDFLEANSDFSICFHDVMILDENADNKFHASILTEKETLTIEDLALRNFIHTPSCVFRNQKDQLPDWFLNCPVGDYTIHLLNAQYGKIKRLRENMAIYRIHSGGIWSINKRIEILAKWIFMLEMIKTKFEKKLLFNFNSQLYHLYVEYIDLLIFENGIWKALKCWTSYFKVSISIKKFNSYRIFKSLARIFYYYLFTKQKIV